MHVKVAGGVGGDDPGFFHAGTGTHHDQQGEAGPGRALAAQKVSEKGKTQEPAVGPPMMCQQPEQESQQIEGGQPEKDFQQGVQGGLLNQGDDGGNDGCQMDEQHGVSESCEQALLKLMTLFRLGGERLEHGLQLPAFLGCFEAEQLCFRKEPVGMGAAGLVQRAAVLEGVCDFPADLPQAGRLTGRQVLESLV